LVEKVYVDEAREGKAGYEGAAFGLVNPATGDGEDVGEGAG